MKKNIIISNKINRLEYLKEVFKYLGLCWTLGRKDFLVKYKQTKLGVIWALFKPIIYVFSLSLLFGNIAGFSSNKLPYPVLVFSGVIFWQFFSSAIIESSNSVLGNMNLVTKVYFPRIILPISTFYTNCVDLLISTILFILLMMYYEINITIKLLLVMVIIYISLIITSLVFSIIIAGIVVKYRDIKHVIPFMLQIGMYITPVSYSMENIPKIIQKFNYFNPIALIITIFRKVLVMIQIWTIIRF